MAFPAPMKVMDTEINDNEYQLHYQAWMHIKR
ncbi:hypothetical protein M272_09900 [Vibrio natriegens NBRC 15636 = ATCC 14048 = DSM 759]|jgi:hypothetical protein|nr:hypothetical protein M272_09900 [Vibrio natriegens NBRC 15636 = ATCC 14048 = DSM 759]